MIRFLSTLSVFLTLISPFSVVAHNPLPPGYKPPSGPYSSLQQNKNGLEDPIYQGDFRLNGSVQVDEKLMKVSEAASDIDFVLEQAATSMSTCIKIDEQQERLDRGYKVLDQNPSGKTLSVNFRQVETIIKQAKGEFEQYKSTRARGHNAYDPNLRAGNELLKQAKEKLKGSRPVINLLWKAAQGISQASQQLAMYLNEIAKTQTNNVPPKMIQRQSAGVPSISSQTLPVSEPPLAPDRKLWQSTLSGVGQSQHPSLDNKLNMFFESLKQRALSEISDPTERERVLTSLTEKFTGIGEGVNEAKEDVKIQAKRAFDETVRQTEAFKKDPVGTMQKTKKAADEFASGLANSTIKALDEAAKDSSAFDRLLKTSVAMVAKSSADYSKLSAKEQGKVIGKNLFWSINPSGSIEGASLASQSFNRAKNVIKPHLTELKTELNMLASAGKEQIANQEMKLQSLAASIGNSQRPKLATLGPSMSTGPPGNSPIEELYNLAKKENGSSGGTVSGAGSGGITKSTIKPGTKIGTIAADELEIREGWALDGQKISKGIEWPNGWGKPSRGEYLTSNGKLYFRPDEASRKLFDMGETTLIPIEKGVPDFIQFTPDSTSHVYWGELTGKQSDKILFVKSLAKNKWMNFSSEEEVIKFLSANDLALHHFRDFITDAHFFQVVPRDIHNYFGHTGYGFKLRQGIK